MARKTIHQAQLVSTANRMIAHLAQSGTREDQVKREAIIALASQVMLDGDCYKGFRYLNPPTAPRKGEIGLVYDDSRIEFYSADPQSKFNPGVKSDDDYEKLVAKRGFNAAFTD